MMLSEFLERTGCAVSAEEYHFIEESYYEFDGNKDEFCKAWLKDKKSGAWAKELMFRQCIKQMQETHKAELEEKQETIEWYNEQYPEMRNERNELAQKCGELQAQVAELTKRVEDAEQKATEAQEDCEAWAEKYERLSKRANEYANKAAESITETTEAKAKVGVLENEVIKLKAKLYDMMVGAAQ